MREFPEFMRRACNAVKTSSQAGGMQGYVYEGVDGTQVVIWQCPEGGLSETHAHDFDEYAIVVQGTFTGKVGDRGVTLGPGDECFVPAGTPHSGSYSANYRAIDAFGGRRARRIHQEE